MIRSLLVLILLAGTAVAAPEVSPRPVARTDSLASVTPLIRPQPRPLSEQLLAEAQVTRASISMLSSIRPTLRSQGLEHQAMAKKRAIRKGAICGDVDLQGDDVGAVPGKIAGCGLPDAVRLRSVSGVGLSQSAIMDCKTAAALKKWVDRGVKPALRNKGKVVQLRVAAHYTCRTRNNQAGAKISEHGRGRAIDISGFKMQDGSTISVLSGWNDRSTKKAMRQIHKAACGPFGTVLGPNSDRFHKDHFHLDTARYRNGAYCR